MKKEKKEELRAKLDKVKIEPEELRKISSDIASEVLMHKEEILKILESEV